jgi:hypothetical protein
MKYKGSVDILSPTRASGWIRNPKGGVVNLKIHCDGVLVAEGENTHSRVDLDSDCAFELAYQVPHDWKSISLVYDGQGDTPLNNSIVIRGFERFGQHPLSGIDRGTFWHLIHHYTQGSCPTIPVTMTLDTTSESDLLMAKRLIKFYKSCLDVPEDKEWSQSGMWNEIFTVNLKELDSLLRNGTPEELAKRLNQVFTSSETDGLGLGHQVFRAASVENTRMELGAIIKDRFMALAEALGVCPIENPEQGLYGSNMNMNFNDLLTAVEKFLNIDVARKKVMGIFGYEYKSQIVDIRIPEDLYAAYRIKQICNIDTRVVEIGGGFGGVAEKSFLMGFKDYTIYDLPIISVIQGYFLAKSISPDIVCLFGEDYKNNAIKLMPFYNFNTDGVGCFFNRDSMPEIPEKIVKKYIKEISKNKSSVFISINQEAGEAAWSSNLNQLRVHTIVKDNGEFSLKSRQNYWIRKGYVEEIYINSNRIG